MYTVQNQTYNNHQIATVLHDANSKKMVIFCHGFRGNATGPNRFFVKAAEKLEQMGISSLRFDQYGSGNSEGDFYDSSFDDWVETTITIAKDYLAQGFRVALFGQSMGASTVIKAASELPEVSGFVAWVPDASIDAPIIDGVYMEENGQRVRWTYWQEAHAADIPGSLKKIHRPGYIVQCTADEYVDAANHQAIVDAAGQTIIIDNFDGYSHSSWSYDQAEEIIDKNVAYIESLFTN